MNMTLLQLRRAAEVEVLTTVPARRVFAVVAFVLLTAFSAHVSAPLPGTSVPVSLQTLVVLLSGMLLGPRLGFIAQSAYLAAGAAGLPVFALGMGLPYLLGPTGGYLLAFPAAAAVAGWIAQRASGTGARSVLLLAVAATVATLVVYAGGWAQLSLLTGDARAALFMGIVPFLIGDGLKVVIAVVLAHRIRRRTLALL